MDIQETFEIISRKENVTQQFMEQFQGKEIYLYGAGQAVEFAFLLFEGKVIVKAIVDQYKTGNYRGIPILSLEEVLKHDPARESVFFLSSPQYGQEIRKELEKYYPSSHIYSSEFALYSVFTPDIEKYQTYLLENKDQFEHLLHQLEDDLSKQTLLHVLAGCATGDLKYFREVYIPNQYYIPEITKHFSNQEVLVEAGSNNGDTLKEFIALCPEFKRAYCLEPDSHLTAPDSGSPLAHMAALYPDRVCIIPKGAWDCDTVLHFAKYANSSQIGIIFTEEPTSSDRIEIPVTDIDSVVLEPITYIKMDIEGCEWKALQGCAKQIQQNRPKLAISIYHKPEDLLTIPQYLKSLVPDYTFYLRHHTKWGTDTVLYAI